MTFDSRLSLIHYLLFGLYIGFMGMGDMRILIASLPRGEVAGWGFGCAAKPWDAELFSV